MSLVGMAIIEDLDLDPEIIANAQNGDSSAQFTVGIAYYHATRVENNCYKAFKWINASAEQGNMEAQFRLADMYALGHGTDRNLVSAHEWYTKSALQDYPKALIRIHNLYVEDKKIHCRGELSSEEEGMNEFDFKKSNEVRELNEYRLNLLQAKNILGGTIEFFSKKFKALRESKIDNEDINHTLGFLYKYGYGIRRISKQAIVFYTKAAEKGYTSAQYNLAYLYQHSHDIKFNYRHAFKWYSKAAEGGSSAAQNNLGYFYEKGLVVDVDFQKALHWYTQAAQKNNKGAMLNIARLYRKGFLDDPDHSELTKWYTMAAEKGSIIAKNCLSLLIQEKNKAGSVSHANVTFVETESSVKSRLHSILRLDVLNMADPKKRNRMEKLASYVLVGDGHAMLELGFKYFDGIDLTQDKDTGFKWIQKAAKANIIKSQLIVAEMYEEGEVGVVKQDYYKAFLWYFLAAKQKSDVARYKLGSLYFKGHGARKDPLEASKWFIWSADQENSNAQYMLGIMRLEEGGVLQKDPVEAFERFTTSASQKNTKALYQLGQMYWEGKAFENGKPIGKNEKRAIRFYKYAACHGDIDSGLLLAKMYSEGNAYIDRNFFEALKHYLKVSEQGDSGSMYKAGCMLLEGDAGVQDYIKAFKLINQAAKNGSYEAQGLLDTPLLYSGSISDYANVLDMFKVVTLTKTADLRYNIGCFYEYGIRGFNNDTLIKPNLEKAFEWYKKAAKNNNPDALYKLGLIHQEGKIVERNVSTAVEHYTKALKASEFLNTSSLFALASIYILGIGIDKDVIQAFCLYLKAADIGHKQSRKVLSIIYGFEDGDGHKYVYPEVIHMLEKVADAGNVIAQYHLGVYYELSCNTELAIKWYTLAAKGKITKACFKLAIIHEKDGEYKDYSRSIELYKVAIENGHDNALFRLARMYHYGKGVPRDYSKAFQMYNDASDLGNKSAYRILNKYNGHVGNISKEANKSSLLQECLLMYEHAAAKGNDDFQYKVGYIYENVLKPPELQNARKWYTMAMNNSHGEAACRLGQMYTKEKDWVIAIEYFNKSILLESHYGCYHLGQIYHKGNGVDVDISKALEYYHKAAEQSNPDAQFMLGQLYESTGEQNNLLEALKCYTKAYLQEHKGAISRLREWEDDKHKDVQYSHLLLDKLQKFADNHGDTRKNTDPEYYGHKYYRLAYMYFSGVATSVNYTKAWKYFEIARREYSNKEAIGFINSVAQNTAVSQQSIFNALIEMFNAMIDQLDEELLYNIGIIYNNRSSLGGTIQQDYSMAFKFLQKSLKKGNTNAQKTLFRMYTSEIGVSQNPNEVLKNHCMLAEKQDDDDNFKLGSFYYHTIHDKETSYSIALIYFQKAADQGHADAKRYLGDMYYYGRGVESSLEKSIELHKSSALKRGTSVNFNIGSQYYDGSVDTRRNLFLALIYFSNPGGKSMSSHQKYIQDICCYRNNDIHIINNNLKNDDKEKENERAKIHTYFADFLNGDLSLDIGLRYYQAFENVEKNHHIAAIYFKRAASLNNAEAQRYLGDMYYYGYAVEKSDVKALQLHIQSINQRDNDDRVFIGLQYYHGSGFITKNYFIAYAYFNEAASEDYYEAQRYLGDMYYHEHHVIKDNETAFKLHKSSANQQTSKNNFEIGRKYYLGSGGIKLDHAIPLIYLNQAINQGREAAMEYILNICYSHDNNDEKVNEDDLKKHHTFSDQLSEVINFKLGEAYYNGNSYTKNKHTLAIIYFSKSVDQNHNDALIYIADMYCYGEGVEVNLEKGMKLHKDFAEKRQGIDNYNTGRSYFYKSKEIKTDLLISRLYFKIATTQENLDAKRCLADMYFYGEGGDQNYEKAITMHKDLAERHKDLENYKIGQRYYQGDKEVKKCRKIAFIYFSQAAARNHFGAKRYLADMYYYGDVVEKNHEKAIDLYTSLAKQRDDNDNYETGRLYYDGKRNIKKSFEIAFIYFESAAAKNHHGAQRYLAHMYYYGEGVEKNHEKAIELYNSSAEQGISDENYQAGQRYYQKGNGYQQNLEVAFIYLSKAASQNHLEALRCLADIHYYGEIVDKDIAMAKKMHTSIAEKEDGDENYFTGRLYYYGDDNVEKNYEIAFIYFNNAALQKHADAERHLADMYYYGYDIQKNYEKAIQLYESSARKDEDVDNYETGEKYYHGDNETKQKFEIALIYFRIAASQGHSEAQRRLADMYYYGKGIEQNIGVAIDLHEHSAEKTFKNNNYQAGQSYYHGEQHVPINWHLAFTYFRIATSQSHHGAQRYLADMFYYGRGIEKNLEKGTELHESLVEKIQGIDNYNIGRSYLYGSKDVEKDPLVAPFYFNKAMIQNDSEALRCLADMYYNGEYFDQDRNKAMELYRSSAKNGESKSNYETGQLYYKGNNAIQQNLEVAFIYFYEAAAKSHHGAQRCLAHMYYYGEGVEKNHEKAIELYNSSAEQGMSIDNYQAGQQYYQGGNGCQKNHVIAFIYFSKAANRNHANSYKYLADMGYFGEISEVNYKQAVELHTYLAEKMTSFDNYDKGQLYYHGADEIKKNFDIAFIYFSQAASRKHLEAQRYLADMYYYGDGTKVNSEKAIRMHTSLAFSARVSKTSDNFTIGRSYYYGDYHYKRNSEIAFIYFSQVRTQDGLEAQRYLADMHYHGDGVKTDIKKGIHIHTSLASQPRPYDNYATGQSYYHGDGDVKQIFEVAFIYFSEAAAQGYPSAKRYLADMYYFGDGVGKNPTEAIKLHTSFSSQLGHHDCWKIGREYLDGSSKFKRNTEVANIYLTEAVKKGNKSASAFL